MLSRVRTNCFCHGKFVRTAHSVYVLTFHFFRHISGLEDLLRSGNMSLYPNVCAEATASFSVLSDTINAVRCTLEQQDRHEWTLLIVRLQKAEQQKLNLSAALHLERIRAQSQQQEVENDAESYEGRKDTLTSTLLNESVKSLQRSIATIVEEINEVLVDIQCALSEEFD